MTKSKDVAAELHRMPKAEILLGAGALAVLLGFVLVEGWSYLFKFSSFWFPTLALLGSVAALTLVILRVLKVEFMPAQSRGWLLLGVALLPALGFVIDQLSQFWHGLMLAGALVMAYGAATSTAASALSHRVADRASGEDSAPAQTEKE